MLLQNFYICGKTDRVDIIFYHWLGSVTTITMVNDKDNDTTNNSINNNNNNIKIQKRLAVATTQSGSFDES